MPPMNATTTSAPLQLEGVNKMKKPAKKKTMGQRMIGRRDPDASVEGTTRDKMRGEGTAKDRY
jgi:hypothetical protein